MARLVNAKRELYLRGIQEDEEHDTGHATEQVSGYIDFGHVGSDRKTKEGFPSIDLNCRHLLLKSDFYSR